MRIFNLPFVRDIDDKIVGGIFNLKQVVFLISILVVFSILFLYSSNTGEVPEVETINWFLIGFKILIFIIYSAIMIALAFIKVGDMTLDKYLIELLKFHVRNKTIIYKK